MTKKSDAPAIRFKGFSDAWEQRKFGEITSKYEDPVPTPHDGYYRLGIRSHAKGTFHSYVAKGQELETAQMHRVAAGNFIVNITFGWEHAVAITDKNDAGKLVSHRFPQFSFAEGMVPEFFRYVIVDEKFRHHLWLASPGGAGRNRVLKLDEMLNYLMRFPSRDEQIKIAEFFRHLDNLITLHQRKFEKLTNVKKSMLEKMFPQNGSSYPEIRFKGFTDPWEQRKLASLCEKFTDGDWIESKDQSDFGVRLVQTGNVGVAEYLDKPNNKKWISEDTFDRLHCEEVLPGDILISRLPEPAGRACIVPLLGTKMITAVDCTIVRTAPDMSNKFLVQYLSSQAYFDDVNTCLAGGTRQRISRGNLANFNVPIPVKKSEQDAIGMFFGYLDNLITLHQRELEKLQNIKKSMLEKMFV